MAKARELRAAFQAAPRAGRAESELFAQFNERMDQFFQSLRDADDQARRRRDEILAEMNALGGASADGERLRTLTEEWKTLPETDRTRPGRLDAQFRRAEADAAKRLREAEQTRRKNAAPFFPAAMREAVRCCAAAAAGEPTPEITVDLTPFPRLAAAVTDASAGTLPEALVKAMAQNTREFKKLLTEWEQLKAAPEKNEVRDLAAELAAAIAGNFGGGTATASARPDRPHDIRRKLLEIGVLDPAEADALLARYEALAATL